MLRSMTAYGRASVSLPLGLFVVEIQSVNRKHLEISTYLPRDFQHFDADIRNQIKSQVSRGQVNVKLNMTFDKESPTVVNVNFPLLKQLKSAWDKSGSELNVDLSKQIFDLNVFLNQPGILTFNDNQANEEAYKAAIKECVWLALTQFIAMKETEGAALKKEFEHRLKLLEEAIKSISEQGNGATDKFRQKLIDKINEVVPGSIDVDDRLLKEIALYAERLDVTEEMTRFGSHLKQADQLLNSKEPSIGKTFEFLLQEMQREINTIGSKSSDIEISRLVILAKTEVEKIREQIQNVE